MIIYILISTIHCSFDYGVNFILYYTLSYILVYLFLAIICESPLPSFIFSVP